MGNASCPHCKNARLRNIGVRRIFQHAAACLNRLLNPAARQHVCAARPIHGATDARSEVG
jgi:hypothetical protein